MFQDIPQSMRPLSKRIHDLVSNVPSSQAKPRPELSDAAKNVRKKIFYFAAFTFLILAGAEPTDDISIFAVKIEYSTALICTFIMVMYLCAHFTYEIWRDFSDNRVNWKGRTSGLQSAADFLHQNRYIVENIERALASTKDLKTRLPELKARDESFLSDFKGEYQTFTNSLQELHSQIDNNNLSPEDVERQRKALLQNLQTHIEDFKLRLEPHYNIAEKINGHYNTQEYRLNETEKALEELLDAKSKYFNYLIIVTLWHKLSFIFFITWQWLFEVIAPVIILIYLTAAIIHKNPNIIPDTLQLIINTIS